MSWIMVGSAAVSVGASLFGSSKSAKAAKKAGKAEAAIHNFNAAQDELDAKYIERQNAEGQIILADQRIKGISKIRATQGKSGLTGVTSMEVELSAVRIYEANRDIFRKELTVKADKFRKSAELNRLKAYAARKGASSAATSAWMQGIGQSASTIGTTAFQLQQLS